MRRAIDTRLGRQGPDAEPAAAEPRQPPSQALREFAGRAEERMREVHDAQASNGADARLPGSRRTAARTARG